MLILSTSIQELKYISLKCYRLIKHWAKVDFVNLSTKKEIIRMELLRAKFHCTMTDLEIVFPLHFSKTICVDFLTECA